MADSLETIIEQIRAEDEQIRRIDESYAKHNLSPKSAFLATLRMRLYRGKMEEALWALLESRKGGF